MRRAGAFPGRPGAGDHAPLIRRGIGALATVLAVSLALCACGRGGDAPPSAAPARPTPADAAELVGRSREAVQERVRAFDVVEYAGDEIVRRGRVVAYPASDKPVIDLRWEVAAGVARVRSDGATVTAELPSGELVYSPWSEAGAVLFAREAGKLVPTALDATSFRGYGAELEADPERGTLRAVAGFPGGGAWTVTIAEDSLLPLSASFRAGADDPLERVTLEEVTEFESVPTSELALAPDAAAAATRFYAGPAPGNPAPDVAFELADGRAMVMSDLLGKVVVVDFWATWCAPCRPAMQKLEELYREHRDDGLEVYGLRLFDSGDPSGYLAELGLTYPIGDGAPFAEPYAIDTYGLPTLYVVDRAGRVAKLVVGFSEAGEAALVEAVEAALAG